MNILFAFSIIVNIFCVVVFIDFVCFSNSILDLANDRWHQTDLKGLYVRLQSVQQMPIETLTLTLPGFSTKYILVSEGQIVKYCYSTDAIFPTYAYNFSHKQ